MKKNYLATSLFFSFLSTMQIYAQDLLQSKRHSPYTYIYQISNEEAKTIHQKKFEINDRIHFNKLIDSFPTYKSYKKKLPEGHYLKVFIDNNQLITSYTSVQNFTVYTVNNNKDLNIHIYDLSGNTISNALVKVNHKSLIFNPKTQLYTDRKSNKKGLLQVSINGFTSYKILSRQYNNSGFKRVSRKILYSFPLRYTWIPIKFTSRIPVDAIKSISNNYSYGVINQTKNFFVRGYHKIACLLDNYYCDDYRNHKKKGFMVFSKPIYKQGETVKFKAFLVNKKGKPINKKLDVMLYKGNKTIKLMTLKPYRPGAYTYSFKLHDSLQLKLDRNYTIYLKNKGKDFFSNSFKYEEYELKGNKLDLNIVNAKHYKGSKAILKVNASDINGLPVLDGRLEILVKGLEVSKYFKKSVFIPDTLLFFKKNLNKDSSTKIEISDTDFPKANFLYTISVRLLTTDNESLIKTEKIKYFYKHNYLNISQKNDSIKFEYFEGDKSLPKKATITASNYSKNIDTLFKGNLPISRTINPYYKSYKVISDSLTTEYKLGDKPASIQCFTERTSDSVHIKIDNPLKLPFFYSIYKNNKRIKEGYSQNLTFVNKSNNKDGYYLFLNYIWGGKMMEENYQIPFKNKELKLTVIEPKNTSPGKKVTINVVVTDKNGKPVKGVDVTAFAENKKFNYQAPTLPYLGKSLKRTRLINNFDLQENSSIPNRSLDYNFWNKLIQLDSIAYYQFIYPKNKLYQFETNTPDGSTQFAPFVFDNGNPVKTHIIYVDNIPVYFSWTSENNFSFNISEGIHQIKLRTALKTIQIDSVQFNKGKKLIFSLDEKKYTTEKQFETTAYHLSPNEKFILQKYLIPYRYNPNEKLVYIKKNNHYQLLNKNYNVAGPFTGQLYYVNYKQFKTVFYHEPGYKYDFSKNLLKMRSTDLQQYFPKYLQTNESIKSIYNWATNPEIIDQMWQNIFAYKRSYKPRYYNPSITRKGNGELILELPKNNMPVNILLFNHNDTDFTRIYSGNTRHFYNLKPDLYRLILLKKDTTYQTIDSVAIKPYGFNHLKIDSLKKLRNNSFTKKVDSLLFNYFQKTDLERKKNQLERERKEINRLYRIKYRHMSNDSFDVFGIVSDETCPLPGVNVLIKGTNIGTETDFDGYYTINVLPEDILVFTYLGMETASLNVDGISNWDMVLNTNNELLEEVVISGYGRNVLSRTSSCSVTNLSNSLAGKISGVQITGGSGFVGASTKIILRGYSSSLNKNDKPLFIVDGIPVEGISMINSDTILSVEEMEPAAATALYGSRASKGVIIIRTIKGKNLNSKRFPNTTHAIAQNNSNYSLRSDFSDEAFWQPKLTTDANGIVTFQTTLPDNITSWNTHYLAMNSKKQTGSANGEIKSYKKLMAQLAVPRFLIENDSVNVIGKIKNTTNDSIPVKNILKINDRTSLEKNRVCKTILVDTMTVTTKKDSLSLKYIIQKDGYTDGEIRTIPVLKKGLFKTKGVFVTLDKDTSFNLQFDKTLGKVKMYAKTDLLGVLENELNHTIHYKYNCNEQLASKLKALLAKRQIALHKGQEFKQTNRIKKTIKLLEKNRHPSGFWGWWQHSPENEKISLHIIEAMVEAYNAGFITIDKITNSDLLIEKLQNTESISNQITILKLLKQMNVTIDYKKFITQLTESKNSTFTDKLRLTELKLIVGLPYSLAYLKDYKKTTLFGNIYYSQNNEQSTLWNNEIQTTLLAYKLLRNENQNSEKLLKIRNYFLEQRKNGFWRNTYESIKITETLLPDFLLGKKEIQKAKLYLNGSYQNTITKFPFNKEFNTTDSLTIKKTGDYPIYLTYYQKYWDKNPELQKGDFEIISNFENNSNTLKAGQRIKMITKLKVKKDSEYLMVSIPIPAGCTYNNKNTHTIYETHREYFKNKAVIFFEYLPKGNYNIELNLISRFSGTFTLNPAKIELMYYPTFSANNVSKVINIK